MRVARCDATRRAGGADVRRNCARVVTEGSTRERAKVSSGSERIPSSLPNRPRLATMSRASRRSPIRNAKTKKKGRLQIWTPVSFARPFEKRQPQSFFVSLPSRPSTHRSNHVRTRDMARSRVHDALPAVVAAAAATDRSLTALSSLLVSLVLCLVDQGRRRQQSHVQGAVKHDEGGE